MKTVIKYVSNDGIEFDTLAKCLIHEGKPSANRISLSILILMMLSIASLLTISRYYFQEIGLLEIYYSFFVAALISLLTIVLLERLYAKYKTATLYKKSPLSEEKLKSGELKNSHHWIISNQQGGYIESLSTPSFTSCKEQAYLMNREQALKMLDYLTVLQCCDGENDQFFTIEKA